ncbi:class C sortase [Lacticaseibacillus sp. N501-2]|uniref:class C sortase n=1 Tax=Lacticaseibacillus salsurae TaxID=3367729 RepID=UPI0038B3988B
MAKRRRPRTHLLTQSIAMICLLIGAVIALYPFYVGSLNDVLDNYRLAQNEAASQKQAAARMAQMAKANARLQQKGLNANADPFAGLSKHARINLKRDQLGEITVPKLKLTLPLFQTLNEETLQVGAAVVPGTSMPVGGLNTHTVIAGHRGLVDRRLFSDLNRVKRGDVFVLKVFKRHLAYKVFRIQVVLPENTSVLQIERGKDLATLLTCTPYMINSHRLLITGHRVPYTPAVAKQVAASKRAERWTQLAILLGSIGAFGLLVGLIGRYIHRLLLKRHLFTLLCQVVDATGAPQKADFQLCQPNGKPLYRHGQLLKASSDEHGQLLIDQLPGGVYLLKTTGFTVRVGTKRLRQQTMQCYPKKHQRGRVKYVAGRWLLQL